MPPPLTPEQFFQLQMQMMATLNNTVQALQQIHAQPPPPPPPQPRDRRAEFLRGHPLTFSHTSDPLQADDWLRAVERQLDIVQCDDRERVLYAAGQLRGAALDWWESHLAPVPGAVPQPQRPRGRYEDEAEGVPSTEAVNLRYNHSAFPLELILPCSIFLKHELIFRYISVFFTSGDYDGHRVS